MHLNNFGHYLFEKGAVIAAVRPRIAGYRAGICCFPGDGNLLKKLEPGGRFLGTAGYYDEIYLPLKKNRNELWVAISENIGGWGIKAIIPDQLGIKIQEH